MTATTEIKSVITEDQAAFARSRAWEPGSTWGWRSIDLWVSDDGCIRVYPHYKFGEIESWIAAFFYTAGDNIPFASKSYEWFKAAIGANS